MMDPNEFKVRYDWFRDFYANLAGLLLQIDGQSELEQYTISKDAPPFAPTDERKFYRFPDPIAVSYDRAKGSEKCLAVPSFVSVLSADALSVKESMQPRALSLLRVLHRLPPEKYLLEPTLAVFAHDPLPHKCPFVKKQDLDETLVNEKRVFSGILECEKKRGNSACLPSNLKKSSPECPQKGGPANKLRRRLSFFLVSLDAFSEESCKIKKPDEIIGAEVIKPLKTLLDGWPRD